MAPLATLWQRRWGVAAAALAIVAYIVPYPLLWGAEGAMVLR